MKNIFLRTLLALVLVFGATHFVAAQKTATLLTSLMIRRESSIKILMRHSASIGKRKTGEDVINQPVSPADPASKHAR